MSAKFKNRRKSGSFRGRVALPQLPVSEEYARPYREKAKLGQGMPYGDAVYFNTSMGALRVRGEEVMLVDGLGQ